LHPNTQSTTVSAALHITRDDETMARAIYPVLMDVIRRRASIDLANLALAVRERCPEPEHPIYRLRPDDLPRPLQVLRAFTSPRGYPDMTCVVVKGAAPLTAEDYADPMRAAARAASFDWPSVEEQLALQCDEWRRDFEAGSDHLRTRNSQTNSPKSRAVIR